MTDAHSITMAFIIWVVGDSEEKDDEKNSYSHVLNIYQSGICCEFRFFGYNIQQ